MTNNDSRNIGYVPQTPGIVSGTISQNITLDINNKSCDQKRLQNALALSHLQDLIETLENGVDTELGAQSDGLSGGQLQRIGLARAIYANPGLLVLDEATSALDAETEAAVSIRCERCTESAPQLSLHTDYLLFRMWMWFLYSTRAKLWPQVNSVSSWLLTKLLQDLLNYLASKLQIDKCLNLLVRNLSRTFIALKSLMPICCPLDGVSKFQFIAPTK